MSRKEMILQYIRGVEQALEQLSDVAHGPWSSLYTVSQSRQLFYDNWKPLKDELQKQAESDRV